MSFADEGHLITDRRDTDRDWDTQADWEANQETRNIDIPGDYFELSDQTVIDDFEVMNMDPYDLTNQWDNGDERIDDSDVFHGDYSVKLDATDADDFSRAHTISTAGLGRYPKQGDTFRIEIRMLLDNVRPGVVYGAVDGDNHYLARIVNNPDDPDELQLYSRVDGSASLIDDAEVSTSLDTWYGLEIDWGNDDAHQVRLMDGDTEEESVSGDNSDHNGKGFGLYQGNNNEDDDGFSVAWDYARVI